MIGYMAIDQYGQTYHLSETKYPRKQLLDMFHRKSAYKMYVDTKEGKTKHIGWIIAGRWLSVYRVFNLKEGV